MSREGHRYSRRGLMRLGALGWLAACSQLVGCAMAPVDKRPRLEGRLALRLGPTATSKGQSLTLGFQLLGDAAQGELWLSQPLGLTVAHARWRQGEALLVTGDDEQRFADLEQLAEHMLGERLPLQALPDWLRGRPWPRAAAQALPLGFAQLGFEVDLSRFDQGAIVARRAASASRAEVRLAVRLGEPG